MTQWWKTQIKNEWSIAFFISALIVIVSVTIVGILIGMNIIKVQNPNILQPTPEPPITTNSPDPTPTEPSGSPQPILETCETTSQAIRYRLCTFPFSNYVAVLTPFDTSDYIRLSDSDVLALQSYIIDASIRTAVKFRSNLTSNELNQIYTYYANKPLNDRTKNNFWLQAYLLGNEITVNALFVSSTISISWSTSGVLFQVVLSENLAKAFPPPVEINNSS